MPGIDGNPNIAEAGRATRFIKSTNSNFIKSMKRLEERKKLSVLEKVLEERIEKLRLCEKERILQIIFQ